MEFMHNVQILKISSNTKRRKTQCISFCYIFSCCVTSAGISQQLRNIFSHLKDYLPLLHSCFCRLFLHLSEHLFLSPMCLRNWRLYHMSASNFPPLQPQHFSIALYCLCTLCAWKRSTVFLS